MGAYRYFKIMSLDDVSLPCIYEAETNLSFPALIAEVIKRYREGYLRRKTDGSYFMRRCMNEDFIKADSYIRVR